MDFFVQPAALDAFADDVETLKGDTSQATDYIGAHLSVDYGDARMFFTAAQACNEVRGAVTASLNRLGQICGASAQELHRSATMYRDTDDAHAAKLDATYPGPR